MGITPWYYGQSLPIWTVNITPDTGRFDLTGMTSSNLALRFINTRTLAEWVGTGTLNIVQNNPAIISYGVVAADTSSIQFVSNTEMLNILLEVTYPNNAGFDVFNMGTWEVVAR